jgi:hypothetical protein
MEIDIQGPAKKPDSLWISTNLETARFPCLTLYKQYALPNKGLSSKYFQIVN